MTDDDGKVLTECHTHMALLDSHYEQLGKNVGGLGIKVDSLNSTVSGIGSALGGLENAVRGEVLPAIRNVPEMMAIAIRYHEENDPLHAAVRDKTKKEIVQLLRDRMSSDPPPNPEPQRESDTEMMEIQKQTIITKNRLYSAIAGLLLTLAGVLGGSQIPSCNDHGKKQDTQQWHSNQE